MGHEEKPIKTLTNNFNVIDLHIHSRYSDGTDWLGSLVRELKENGISVFSVTDHDTVDFYKNYTVHDMTVLEGMRLIPGIEFSCKTEFGKCHILGYGIDINNKLLNDIINATSALRKEKLIKRLCYLERQFGITFSEDEKTYLSSEKSVGKPHIAKLLADKGYAGSIAEAIKKYLSSIPHDEDDRIDAKIAVDAIVAAGGIPVWAHPLGGEGEKRLSEEELRTQMQCLTDKGIEGVEYYYSRYSAEDRKIIKNAMLKTKCADKLLISGGSDYHGRNKNVRPGELSLDGEAVSGKELSILSKLRITI